jgi:hypothetical protein
LIFIDVVEFVLLLRWITTLAKLSLVLTTSFWNNIHQVRSKSKYLKIRVIKKLPNSEQSYKGKVKTHKYINRQNQSTTGKLWKPGCTVNFIVDIPTEIEVSLFINSIDSISEESMVKYCFISIIWVRRLNYLTFSFWAVMKAGGFIRYAQSQNIWK